MHPLAEATSEGLLRHITEHPGCQDGLVDLGGLNFTSLLFNSENVRCTDLRELIDDYLEAYDGKALDTVKIKPTWRCRPKSIPKSKTRVGAERAVLKRIYLSVDPRLPK